MQPKLITIPYSTTGKLYDAYNDIFALVQDHDWVCFCDGDTAFLELSDFGHLLQDYINLYPATGMFTCYASRCHYAPQRRKGLDMTSDSINYWAAATNDVKKLHPKVKPLERRIAGHLVMMQKATWLGIQLKLKKRLAAKPKKILGFDTQLTYAVLDAGLDIKLMRGILVFHYLRKLTGKNPLIK